MNYNKIDYDKMENTNAIPCEEPVCKGISVKDSLQESRKILHELNDVLESIIIDVMGDNSRNDSDKLVEPDCLNNEAKIITGIAYELLNKAKRIREALL